MGLRSGWWGEGIGANAMLGTILSLWFMSRMWRIEEGQLSHFIQERELVIKLDREISKVEAFLYQKVCTLAATIRIR
jgi:hypothetical protein